MEFFEPEGVAPPRSTYSHAIATSGERLVFLSGQVPVDEQGEVVGRGDVHDQARQVFANLGAVLESAGASFRDVVKMTIFVVGVENVASFRRFRADYFDQAYPDGRYPTTTLVVVAGLAHEDFLVEVEAIAALAG